MTPPETKARSKRSLERRGIIHIGYDAKKPIPRAENKASDARQLRVEIKISSKQAKYIAQIG
jgi:hypothetical protein